MTPLARRADDDFLQISWHGGAYTTDLQIPDRHVYQWTGDIETSIDIDEMHRIGRFSLYYIDVRRAVAAGVSVFDVFDSDEATVDYFAPLYGERAPRLLTDVTDIVGPNSLNLNILIIGRVEVLPEFRGASLGLQAMEELIARSSSGAALIAIKPFPLQFEAKFRGNEKARLAMALEGLSHDESQATSKLRRHYAKIGFVQVPGTSIMVKAA